MFVTVLAVMVSEVLSFSFGKTGQFLQVVLPCSWLDQGGANVGEMTLGAMVRSNQI